MSPDEESRQLTQATKLTLIGVFLGLLAAFTARQASRGEDVQISPFDLLLLGLTTYRAGHLIAYERVAEPVRAPLTETVPDRSGVGETVVASGRGVRYALGELVSCPICVGTWAAAGLVYGLHLAPRPTRVFLAVMSTTGLAELLHCSTEAASWVGRAARALSGSHGERD
ncbi:MAG TPA: DUF1360 domain-containing protein [Chloroflexota bacterium]|nr:DUF1360 domain-containing protein [Chloroflexota bacterium]